MFFFKWLFFFEVKNLEINNIVIKAGRNLKTDEDGIKMEPDKFSTPVLANISVAAKRTTTKKGSFVIFFIFFKNREKKSISKKIIINNKL